jgi:hypothetical protein
MIMFCLRGGFSVVVLVLVLEVGTGLKGLRYHNFPVLDRKSLLVCCCWALL